MRPGTKTRVGSVCLTENDIQALLGGVLGPGRVREIEAHLDACIQCQLLVSAGVRTASLRTHGLDALRAELATFEAGAVVGERYEIRRFIARGGMGEVYEAHDRMLVDDIALKVLVRPPHDEPDAVSRLRGEVQLARRVTSPHISRIYDL